jgi:hypothetical protein
MTELQPTNTTKPGLVIAIAILTLISGIFNIFWSGAVAIFLFTTLLGIICVPLASLPLGLGILEIIYAARLLSSPTTRVKPAKYLAILEICNVVFANAFSFIVGILALVFYNELVVQTYFDQMQGNEP